ncbi:YicC/YloC family endoribonuclease [Castellaniella sp. S9]|uniref:YicC/YloC family endoribonuclease n=1 Tax=Castellaniella sp. S9 TaxID=2993652 RepID=UPI0022B5A7B2|nr:YicC/YloC family endoribonuclease [Castellaniella sp. S9]
MIRSMTAFGAARLESEPGAIGIEIRSVNNRYLDLNLRLPDDLRFAESRLRELVGRYAQRGKIEVRVSYAMAAGDAPRSIDPDALRALAAQLHAARALIPDVPAPTLAELLGGGERTALDAETWLPLCERAMTQALDEFTAARAREGGRLADAMLQTAREIAVIVEQVEADLPALIDSQQARVAQRLREALEAASPEGFAQIGGAELSARIAQEAGLFGLRVDVAEEIARLRSHLAELQHILGDPGAAGKRQPPPKGSRGKRLDFLFQEMNREANTLGSKSAALSVTQAAIDLKLLIEQMREQAQNIE